MIPNSLDVNTWKWEDQIWQAPDGKRIPFIQADVTSLVLPMVDGDDEFWCGDYTTVKVLVSKWSHKYKVALIKTSSRNYDNADKFYTSTIVIKMGDYSISDFEADTERVFDYVRRHIEKLKLD